MITKLDGRGIARGALLAGIVGITASILARYVASERPANVALSIVLLAGMVLGGFAAGREAPGYELTNAVAATGLAFAVVETVGVLSLIARGDTGKINPFSVVFLAFVALSCGAVGGFIAQRNRNRSPEGGNGRQPQGGRT